VTVKICKCSQKQCTALALVSLHCGSHPTNGKKMYINYNVITVVYKNTMFVCNQSLTESGTWHSTSWQCQR